MTRTSERAPIKHMHRTPFLDSPPPENAQPSLRSYAHCQPGNAVRRFIADETAATAVEYCLIASGIALGILVAVAGIEASINAKFTAINSSLR